MNAYFRLIGLFFGYFFSRRDRYKPTDAQRVTMRVWLNDIDLNGHMNNGRYLTVMDLGRLSLILKLGYLKPIIKHRMRPVVAGVNISYFKSLQPLERFTLSSQLIYWDENWFYIRQDCNNQHHQLSASALVKVAFLHNQQRIEPSEFLAAMSASTAISTPSSCNPSTTNIHRPDMPNYLKAFIAGEKTWLDTLKDEIHTKGKN